MYVICMCECVMLEELCEDPAGNKRVFIIVKSPFVRHPQ